MSKYDAAFISRFQPRGRKPKNVKPRKMRKAIRQSLRFYEGMFSKFDLTTKGK